MQKFLTDFEGKAYKMDKKSASLIKKLENIEKKDAKNDDDLRFLIKNASSGNAETRSLIARLLVDFSGEDAENALLDLCGDSDELVRTNACDSLAVYPSKKVFLRLLRIFGNDGSLLVKNFALLSAIDIMQNVNSWLQGNFSMILKGNYELLYLSIPLMAIAFFYAHKFTVVGMGEDFATNLGLDYNKIVNLGLIIVSIVTVCVVIIAGEIPYIGLIVPNLVSLYKGDNVHENILDTALFGAIFVLFCDILARVFVYPYELSVGLTVGVIGSGMFLYLVLRRKSYAS